MSSSINEQELLKRLAALPREIRPENDPWHRIESRISGSPAAGSPVRQRRGTALFAVAAVAVLAIAAGLTLRTDRQVESPVGVPVEVAATHSGLPGMLAGSEAEYQAAFREYIAIGDTRDSLPAETVEKIESGWADLVHVEAALAEALAEHPNDRFLGERMLELRARQLGYLKRLANLEQSSRRLTI